MRLAVLGLFLAVAGANPSCFSCQAGFYHNGNELPFNDLGCFDQQIISPEYSKVCENAE